MRTAGRKEIRLRRVTGRGGIFERSACRSTSVRRARGEKRRQEWANPGMHGSEATGSRGRYLHAMPRRAPKPTHSFTDASRGVRIQKVLADAGVASRRAAEALVAQGLVTVNGEVIDALPAWVDASSDRIVVEGKPLRRSIELVYVMLNKPMGFVCTNSDPEGRKCANDLVEHPSKVRLYPVGRLDMDSSGLLLLTNDGELANRLTHPRYEVHKEYEVLVKGALNPADVARLEEGIFLPAGETPGSRTRESHLKILRRERDRTLLTMELREGRNRQIRRMMADLGHPVKRLRRIRMGPLRLKGLGIGAWRDLTPSERTSLKREAFADAAKLHRK